MNANCFKTVFSERLGCLVAVGEHACSQGKSSGESAFGGSASYASVWASAGVFIGALVLSQVFVGLAWAQPAANALPTGGTVVHGAASLAQSANQLNITQATQRAAINWQSFDIGASAKVNVVQPNAQAVLLNRVVGQSPSQIFGQLQANGHVILVNPNGVLFGKDGSVNAGSFTASTLGITDANFMAGNMVYERNGSTAGVVNQGTIEVSPGGYVALLGASVSNEGKIIVPKGGVVLGAAETIKVPVSGSGRIKLELTAGDINASVKNSGTIVSEGGQVYMQALALNRAAAHVIQSGSIDTTGEQGGAVHLLADGGTIKVDGSITANSTGTDDKGQARKGGDIFIGRDEETGVLAAATNVSGAKLESSKGFVETSGDWLATYGTRVVAKDWLLDPTNITIAASGASGTAYASNYTAGADSVILASDISGSLTAGTSVTIATSASGASAGHIAVNESIAKTGGGDATLTLQAHGNITVAASKTITSNTGKLNVVFNSDSDGISGGGIVFNSGSGITSNGGNITLGGGTAPNGTGFATADGTSTLRGIHLESATISAGGGNIAMNGQTAVTNYQASLSNVAGIYMAGSAVSTTGSGTIQITGKNQNTDTQSQGLVLASGTITGGSTGAVSMTGDSRGVTSSTFSFIRGALIGGTVATTGGNVSVTGFGGVGAQYDFGLDISGSVTAIGSGTVSLSGTAGAGGSGGNVGVNTSGAGTISTVDGAIDVTGTGASGNGVLRNHGVLIGGTNAIRSTGTGSITVTGAATNSDNGFSRGVSIEAGGLRSNSGNIKVDSTVPQNYQVAAYINAPITSTSGNVYIRSSGANIQNTAAGTVSGNNVSIDNTGGTIDANGVITKGTGGASTWAGVIEQNGVGINGSVTAANNLNIYGNQTGSAKGVNIAGATTTVSGKNVTLYGNNSSTGNGVLLSGATLSGHYINATGATNTGTQGFVWQGGNINTTGTSGTSTASVVKGISAASGNTNGFGAFMMIANSATNAASGTSLTFAGEATNLAAGVNTNERGILVQGGFALAASGDITLDGSSKSSEGIAFGGTINMATVAGVTNKLTIKGTAAASSNNGWNAINFSGAINGNASTSSINFMGDAKNLSGANRDNAVNISGAITGNAANVNIQSTGATIVTSAAITGANISIDNTNGTINSGTGAITAGAGTAGSATGISIAGNITATGNLNLSGVSTGGTGFNLAAARTISGANIQATGKTTNGAYGVVFNGTNSVTTTGTSGDSQIKGITTAGGTNALLAWGGLNLTSATGTTLTLWGDGTSTGDRATRFDGGVTTNGAVTLKGTSTNATSLMFINGAVTANENSALTLSGVTSASNQSAVYFVNNGGVALRNGATVNITGQNTTTSGAGTGVLIQGGGIYNAAGATSAGAVTITGSVSSGTAGSTGVSVQAGVSTDGNTDIQGNVASAASTGVSITSSGGVASSGTNATINIGSNYGITHAGYMNVSGATGTGSNINLTSTNNNISGAGTIGDSTNKNASVTFTQAISSTYSGAINAANFTKAGVGALTLDSWLQTPSVATNVSNAYTVKDGSSLTLSPGATLATLAPVSVNVENTSSFTLTGNSSSRWNNTAFNFTGGSGGGTMNLGGNPIGANSTTNTFTTSGGATNTVTGGLNANGANVNFNLTAATSGTGLLEGGFAALAFTQNTQGGYGLGSSGAGGNAGTVNMSGGGNLLFKDSARATTFNINAGNVQVGDGSAATASATAILDATNVSIAAGSKLTFNRSEAYSNASVITGAGSLVQAGAGTLTLTGNSNAFAGDTTVNAGKTLAIGTGGSLGAAGSTLSLADSASSLLFTEASGTSIVGSTISGAGFLSHSGAGTGVLTANNNYSGATTVSGGTLQIGNATTTGTLGTANAVTLSNNATLAFNRIATTTIDKTISGNGNVTANITGDLALTSNIALTGSNTINLTASGSITETSGSLAATNLYMTATTGDIGSVGQRIQSSVNNMALTAAGDAFVTEANGVSIAANVGKLDLSTTNGTLNVSNVNSVSGITASTGNVTLSGTTDTGNGIYIGSSITASNGTVTLDGTTSSATSANAISPDAGVKSIATVTAKNINMSASATAANGGLLGYYGGGNWANFVATEQLNLTGTAAGTGNGFYSYIGTFSSGTGMSIAGSSTAGQGVGLVNGITMTNSSTGDISITGTATDGTKQGIGLRGIAVTNGGGNTVLTAVNGVIATDAGNPAWNTGVHTNTITSNGTGYVHVIAGNGSAANTASIDGTVFNITQNGNAGVLVSTSGTGNVTAPKITNVGTGDIVVAAGTSIAAGTGTGGQILTVANNALTQTHVSTPGKTYVYSGSADATGVLSYLSADFAALYYQGTSQALNTGFNQAFDANHANDMSVPSGGSASSTQVFFRSTTKPGFSMTLANSSKAFGDTDPNLTTTSGAILTNAYAGVGGNNTFAVASADVIGGLTGSRDPGVNVGTYAYNLSASGFNTTLTSQPNLVIGKRDITLASIVSSVKTYDGTDAATIDSGTFGNIYNNETLLINGAGIFSDKNAGTGKTVTVSDVTALTKSDGTGAWSNYNLTTTGSMSTTGSITPASLVVQVNNSSAFVTMNASQAVDNGLSYSGFVNGETAASALTGTGTRTYLLGTTTPVAGTHINAFGLSATPTALHGNYIVTVQNGNLTVVPADKLLISIASKTETYGVLTAANAGASASTVTAQYCLTSNCASSLVDLTVDRLPDGRWRATDATNTAVTFSTLIDSTGHLSTGGYVNVGNYYYDASVTTPPAALNFNGRMVNGGVLTVQAKSLTLDGSGVSKTYDGTTALAGRNVGLTNAMAGDDIFATSMGGSFGNKNAGTQSFTLTGLSLSGADRANYSVANSLSGTTGQIVSKVVTLQAGSVAKVYDGTTSYVTNQADLDALSSQLVSGDLVTAAQLAFLDKNVSRALNGNVLSDKALALNSVTVNDGNSGGNYSLSLQGNSTSTMTPKSLQPSGAVADKVYDGTQQAALGDLSGAGVASGDVVAFQAGSALFSDKNVARDGSGNVVDKAVTVSGLSMTGLDAGNYSLASNNFTGSARITPRLLSTTGTRVADKTQDGTTQATVSLGNLVGLVGVETLQAVAAASFDTAATGSNKAVNVSYTLLNGTNGGLAGNYALPNEVLRANILASSTLKPVLINPVQSAQVPASNKPGSKVGVGAAAASVATLDTLKPAVVLESQEKCSTLSLDDCDCTESKLEGVDICLVPAGVAKRQLPGLAPVLSDAVQR